jgi:hypothetical protein
LCKARLAARLVHRCRRLASRQGIHDVGRISATQRRVSRASVPFKHRMCVHPTLMSCQHALSMGSLAGAKAARSLLGQSLAPYEPPPYVTCLDLGGWGALLTQGWDRTPVKSGAEAEGKAVKRMINTELIYPPRSGDRREILDAAVPGARRRAVA